MKEAPSLIQHISIPFDVEIVPDINTAIRNLFPDQVKTLRIFQPEPEGNASVRADPNWWIYKKEKFDFCWLYHPFDGAEYADCDSCCLACRIDQYNGWYKSERSIQWSSLKRIVLEDLYIEHSFLPDQNGFRDWREDSDNYDDRVAASDYFPQLQKIELRGCQLTEFYFTPSPDLASNMNLFDVHLCSLSDDSNGEYLSEDSMSSMWQVLDYKVEMCSQLVLHALLTWHGPLTQQGTENSIPSGFSDLLDTYDKTRTILKRYGTMEDLKLGDYELGICRLSLFTSSTASSGITRMSEIQEDLYSFICNAAFRIL